MTTGEGENEKGSGGNLVCSSAQTIYFRVSVKDEGQGCLMYGHDAVYRTQFRDD